MDKYTWKTICRKTAYASGKKRLSMKELRALQQQIVKLGQFIPSMLKKETFKEHLPEPMRIDNIIDKITNKTK